MKLEQQSATLWQGSPTVPQLHRLVLHKKWAQQSPVPPQSPNWGTHPTQQWPAMQL